MKMNTADLNSNLSAAPNEVGLSAEHLAPISATAQAFIDDGQLAGAVTVVARHGKVAHFETHGMMDIAANKPMQKDTIFRIYSMTKPIATAAVMLLCYAPWPEQLSNSVRIATWKRDRLGYFQAADTTRKTAQPRHVISAPIDLEEQPCSISLNVDGLSEYGQVTVDILDKHFQPLDGYASEDCLPLTSGFHQKVNWKSGERIKVKETIRIRLNFTGIRPEDPKVYAIYVEKARDS